MSYCEEHDEEGPCFGCERYELRKERDALRAALEEIAKYDAPAEGGAYTKMWMRLGKIASDALKRCDNLKGRVT